MWEPVIYLLVGFALGVILGKDKPIVALPKEEETKVGFKHEQT